MTAPNANELALLRSKPHATDLYLSIYQPTTVMAAQCNITGSLSPVRIEYDTVSTGSYANIVPGQTLWLGTTPGASDVGKVRVRGATGTYIDIAENALDWQDNYYITVVNFFEIWPIYTRFVQSGETAIPYVDYDLVYTNQNSKLGSLVVMGCNYAGFTDQQVWYSASGTYNVLGESLTYEWTFEGGNPGSFSGRDPGYVTYNTPGHYITKLAVTSTSGAVDWSRRHISIYNRPSTGTQTPFLKWEMDKFTGSRDQGGYTTSLRVYDAVPDKFCDGALVVIFAEDRYGTTTQSLGGNSEKRQTIFFSGYIREGTIRYDWQQSIVEFEVVSITEVMKGQPGDNYTLSDPMEDEENPHLTPETWQEISEMNMAKVMFHLGKWHSTLNRIADVKYSGVLYGMGYAECDPSSNYDNFNTTLKDICGSLITDRQGNVYAETGPEAIHDAATTITPNLELTRQDWVGEPNFNEVIMSPLSYLEMGGSSYNSVTGGTAYLAGAPGTVMGYYGKSESQDNLVLYSQSQLNTLVGDVYAYRNARFPDVQFELNGNYRNFDIAPLELVKITLAQTDTQRRLVWASKAFHITSMNWDFQEHWLGAVLNLHEITAGKDGITIVIPEIPDINIPPEPPPLPDIPWPDFPFPYPWIPPTPPPVVPPSPPTGTNVQCCQDPTYGSNGPFNLWMAGTTLRSDGEDTTHTHYGHFARSSAHVFKTTVLLNGCLETSLDGINWTPSLDTTKLLVWNFSGITGKPVVYAEVTPPAGGSNCGTWTCVFNNPSCSFMGGIGIKAVGAAHAEGWVNSWEIGASIYASGGDCRLTDKLGVPITTAGDEGNHAELQSEDDWCWVIYDFQKTYFISRFDVFGYWAGDNFFQGSIDLANWYTLMWVRGPDVGSFGWIDNAVAPTMSIRYLLVKNDYITLLGRISEFGQWHMYNNGAITRFTIQSAYLYNIC